MSLLQRLFGAGPSTIQQPDIPFGRYTDAYKTQTQLAAWDQALELFESGRLMQAYRQLFVYLRDDHEDNLRWKDEGDVLHFEFQQGSRIITGIANAQKVKAESKIARADDLNVGFLRRLMEQNYTLKFCRYALSPENCLTIVFDTPARDGSPLKLLHALRELALSADKQDDLLLDEFQMLQPAETPVGIPVPEPEKAVKYAYIRREIEAAFAEMDRGKPGPNQFPGGYAYLFLELAFRLDYIVKPEGYMMDMMERLHQIYFSKQDQNVQAKLFAIRKELQKLLDRPQEDLHKEMYRTRSTFGINPPVGQDRIKSLIEGELPNMDWHLNQNHTMLALAVPRYIAGYAMFHYAPPKPIREMLHLFFQILEQDVFVQLGFQLDFIDQDGRLQKRSILQAIKRIAETNSREYPGLKPDTKQLDFNSPVRFARTYLEMIKDMNLHRAE
jgi:hypothetical protein